jgi:predicted adenine nucleotide alpha hydrolase (AANH) superfamily ATPase
MNESYYKLGLKELESLDGKKKILLHSCCAPCSSHVISYLTKYFDITILYYNPNISPKEEYEKRKFEQIRLIKEIDKINKIDIIDCDYDNDLYESKIKGYEDCPERGERCTICFNLRLSKTAKLAKELNYDYYRSTLTVSPYKNSKLINEIGEKLGKEIGIKWLYSDFKKENGYKHSIDLSKKYGLYRQDYCGCKYSVRNKIND